VRCSLGRRQAVYCRCAAYMGVCCLFTSNVGETSVPVGGVVSILECKGLSFNCNLRVPYARNSAHAQQAESTVIFRRWGDLSSSSGASPHSCSGSKRSRLDSYSTSSDEDHTVCSDPLANHSYWHHSWPTLGAERDPVGFSYFLAANLPLPTEQLLQLLQALDVVDRLRLAVCCPSRAVSMPTCVQPMQHTGMLLNIQCLLRVPLTVNRIDERQAVHPVHGGGVWKGASVRALQAATSRETRSIHSARGGRHYWGVRQSTRVRRRRYRKCCVRPALNNCDLDRGHSQPWLSCSPFHCSPSSRRFNCCNLQRGAPNHHCPGQLVPRLRLDHRLVFTLPQPSGLAVHVSGPDADTRG
jgi:hypothetical protein